MEIELYIRTYIRTYVNVHAVDLDTYVCSSFKYGRVWRADHSTCPSTHRCQCHTTSPQTLLYLFVSLGNMGITALHSGPLPLAPTPIQSRSCTGTPPPPHPPATSSTTVPTCFRWANASFVPQWGAARPHLPPSCGERSRATVKARFLTICFEILVKCIVFLIWFYRISF